MDWVLAHGQLIFNCLVIAVVGAVWLYARWGRNKEKMERDLEQLLQVGLDWLKEWAGDELANVSQEHVWKVADRLYDRYVEDTVLGRFVDRAALRSLLWGSFCKMRDRFIEVDVLATTMTLS